MNMAGDLRQRPLSESHCDRAREWSSLRVDGELSEIEDALLEKHLGGCPDCRSFEADLHSVAHVLRSSPPEVSAFAFRMPARPAVRFPVSRRLAVAAVAVALALGSFVGSMLERPATLRKQPAHQVSWLTHDLTQLRQLPRQQQLKPVAPQHGTGGPPEGII